LSEKLVPRQICRERKTDEERPINRATKGARQRKRGEGHCVPTKNKQQKKPPEERTADACVARKKSQAQRCERKRKREVVAKKGNESRAVKKKKKGTTLQSKTQGCGEERGGNHKAEIRNHRKRRGWGKKTSFSGQCAVGGGKESLEHTGGRDNIVKGDLGGGKKKDQEKREESSEGQSKVSSRSATGT